MEKFTVRNSVYFNFDFTPADAVRNGLPTTMSMAKASIANMTRLARESHSYRKVSVKNNGKRLECIGEVKTWIWEVIACA